MKSKQYSYLTGPFIDQLKALVSSVDVVFSVAVHTFQNRMATEEITTS